jgi:hypothetical protein
VSVGSWFGTLTGIAKGQVQFCAFELIGSLGDRVPRVYELDARISSRRLRANLRRQEAADRRDARRLRWSERSTYSQNGEDGVIEEIFARIGTTDRFLVEIGASDGAENCTRNLVEAGWTGVWVEADPGRAVSAAAVAPGVDVIGQSVTRHNVADVLGSCGISPTFDLLVIDIDGDDLGVLRRTLHTFRPRVLVVEYNAAFTPRALWSRGDSPAVWDGTFRHGATLGALRHATVRAGYALVHCERAGVNAFFVRADLIGDQFPQAGRVRDHYRAAAFTAHPFGHPRSRRALDSMAPLEVEQFREVQVERVEVLGRAKDVAGFVEVAVGLRNGTSRWLTSGEPNGIHLSLRELDAGGDRGADNRISLPRPIAPFASTRIRLWYRVPADGQTHRLRVTLVCERLFWREDLGGAGAYVDLEL